ncbi:MAG: DUF4158 domain-containing protein, partial [Methylocystis sp.]|nr:DUF4158 domain-containing protein [Methylocystis sp.]
MAARLQTVTGHSREVMAALNLRPANRGDFELMIQAGAEAAWSTDRGVPIVEGILKALRDGGIALPTIGRIERAAIAGRARGRKQAYLALTATLSPAQREQLDTLLLVDEKSGRSPIAWLREVGMAPKAENVRGLLERLRRLREIAIDPHINEAIHADRFQQLVQEARVTPAQLLSRYRSSRRQALLTAFVLDQEKRLVDAALEMTDQIIGGSFARAGKSKERSFVASGRDVGRLMRLFHSTIDALATAQDGSIDDFEAVDRAVGWDKLLRARVRTQSACAGGRRLIL